MARRGDGIYLRGKTWCLDFRHDGQRYQERLGRNINKTVAREIAQVKRAAILKGEAGIGRKKKDIKFDDAAKLFLAAMEELIKIGKLRPKTVKSYRENIVQLKKSFNGKMLSKIHPFLLKKYRLKREKARIGFNREMACLSRLINWCIKEKKFEGVNPTIGLERFEENQRKRALSRDEETQFLAVASERLRTIILLGIYVGLRVKSQILHLKKSDINLTGGYLIARSAQAKNKMEYTIPLRKELIQPLKAQMARSRCEWVFTKKHDPTSRLKDIRTMFETACERAKISNLKIHDLRHTFATRLVTEGKVDLITVMELGGWKRLDMVKRYANPADEHKVKSIESIQFTTLFTTPENPEVTELPQAVENKSVGT
ncbi:site-specific integrase [Acidobacteria bacterium AH-259-O06]|nr:site-specific integrase [Acidobacteria bacterium AH-259-O06]